MFAIRFLVNDIWISKSPDWYSYQPIQYLRLATGHNLQTKNFFVPRNMQAYGSDYTYSFAINQFDWSFG